MQPSSTTINYGLFDSAEIVFGIIPADAAKKLLAAPDDNLWSGAFINAIFGEVDFNSIVVPESAKFNATSTEALGTALCNAVDIQTLSFKNCAGRSFLSVPHILGTCLPITFSLKTIDLTNCGIDANSAKNTVARAISGNKTVFDWIFSENPIGDDGSVALIESLVRTSAQRVSFRKCEIANLIRACDGLMRIQDLYAFDLRQNPSYESDSHARDYLVTKQSALEARVRRMFPRNQSLLNPFGVSGDHNANEKTEVNGEQQEKSNNGGENELVDGEQENNQDDEQQHNHVEPSLSRNGSARRWKRKANTPIISSRRNHDHDDGTKNYDSRNAPFKSGSQTRDINQGVQDWKEKRNTYNEYIRGGGGGQGERSGTPTNRRSTAHNSEEAYSQMRERALKQPTFCLGKRIDHIKRGGPSAAFRGSPIRREPGVKPKEENNNHNNNGSQPGGAAGSFNENEMGHFKAGADPRDIGYFARQCQSGKIKPSQPWSKSNSTREVRFGIDERQNGRAMLLKEHQAPDPGYYKLKDEWEERREKYLNQSKLRGANGAFGGGSATVRTVGPQHKTHSDGPGPGAYEIP